VTERLTLVEHRLMAVNPKYKISAFVLPCFEIQWFDRFKSVNSIHPYSQF